jgi:acetylornithine/succinyldiaminopimelate/putrescine aminotransferase
MSISGSQTADANFVDRAHAVLMQNYGRFPVQMVRGHGSELFDSTGRAYIDLFAGFGGTVIGHAHPELVRAITEQAQQMWAVGNQFHSLPQVELAERLAKTAFAGRAFFCHSGLEANEAAVKLARLRGLAEGGQRWKTVSLIKSFHGRSLAMIAATGNPAIREGFGPPVPGFSNVDPLDLHAIEHAIDHETACLIMEPIQGEGGINLYPPGHVGKIRKLCDAHGVSLIFDEVWTGVGRTGRWFGHQHFVDEQGNIITPDIMTLGKALGGGLPVGAMWARPELAKLLVAGKHGCTLGGNPICMAVSRTLFDVIERDGLVARAERLGEMAMSFLRDSASLKSKVKDVRGRGLFIGVEFDDEPTGLLERCLDAGVIANITYKKIVRIAPAMTISESELLAGLERFAQAAAT